MLTRKILFVFLLVISITGILYSQEEAKRFREILDVHPNVFFMIKHKYGKVELIGKDEKPKNGEAAKPEETLLYAQDKVIIEAVIRAKGEGAKKFVEGTVIDIQDNKSNVNVNTKYPNVEKKNNFSYSVDYIIHVPIMSRVSVNNEFGNTFVINIKGDVDVDLAYGKLEIHHCYAPSSINGKFSNIFASKLWSNSRINNSNGKIVVQEMKGDLEVNNAYGQVELNNIDGNANVTNGYGKIIGHDIKGRAILNNQFGGIDVMNIGGSFEITNKNSDIWIRNAPSGKVTNSFGSINVIDIHGKAGLTINNSNGVVSVSRSQSDVLLHNQYNKIQLNDINGRIDMQTNNCFIDMTNIAGDVKLENSYGNVKLDGSSGDINIRNKNAMIGVSGIKDLAKTYILENEFGMIEIEFPKNLSANINAITSYGNINSDFPLHTTKTVSRTESVGKIGDGMANVKLETRNASIHIKKTDMDANSEKMKNNNDSKPAVNPEKSSSEKEINKSENKKDNDYSNNNSGKRTDDKRSTMNGRERKDDDLTRISYSAKPNDTIRDICKKFRVKKDDLIKWNRSLSRYEDREKLKRGMMVIVYKKF